MICPVPEADLPCGQSRTEDFEDRDLTASLAWRGQWIPAHEPRIRLPCRSGLRPVCHLPRTR